MKTKITVPQSKFLTDTIFRDFCLRLLTIDKDNVSITTKDEIVSITFLEGIKPNMFSNQEFQSILTDVEIDMEGILLYIPVLAKVLDEKVPESFPYSKTADQIQEDETVIEGEQVTVKEYFPIHQTDGTKAVIKLQYRRAGLSVMLSEDFPNKQVFLLFLQWVTPKLIDEILASPDRWVNDNFVVGDE